MGTSLKVYLSEDDFERAMLRIEGKTAPANIILEFLSYLEKKYAISDFPLNYFLPEDAPKDVYWISLPYTKPGLAALEFLNICHDYLINGNHADNSTEIAQKIRDKMSITCWKVIKKIDRTRLKSRDDFYIYTYIFFYLEKLLDVENKYGDIHSISKIYYQLISTIEKFEHTNRITKLLSDFGNSISSFDNKILSALYEFNNNDFGILLNSVNIKAYIEAIQYSLDDEPCLIYGETGTGKEFIAKTIHLFSRRSKNCFQAVNCGGFTDSLFQSEIQGISQGTATTTLPRLGVFLSSCRRICPNKIYGYYINRQQRICFQSSDKDYTDLVSPPPLTEVDRYSGTIFLDEVNSLNISHQAALLRIIQENEVLVLGENIPRKYQSKVITASNSDLHNDVQKGNFREDLFFRLSTGVIYLPPLRSYKDYFNEIINSRTAFIVKKFKGNPVVVRKAAINKMKKHNWPGNFRELDNVLYRSIKKAYLKNRFHLNASDIELPAPKLRIKGTDMFLSMNFNELIIAYHQKLYELSGGNQTVAAEISGIQRNSLRDKWIKLGIHASRPYGKDKSTFQ